MVFAPELRTHAQRVCFLYKKAMRMTEAYYCARALVRYHQVQLRAEFDKNKDVKDEKEARSLYFLGEQKLFNCQHAVPSARFARSPGLCAGAAYGRVVEPLDWVLDYWHPVEKNLYPEYFKRRECRKCEYIQHWKAGTFY